VEHSLIDQVEQESIVPKAFQEITPNAEFNSRLRTTFALIEKSSKISPKLLENKLNQIRNDFTRPLGERWGRVLLRSVRPKFDKEIANCSNNTRRLLRNRLKNTSKDLWHSLLSTTFRSSGNPRLTRYSDRSLHQQSTTK
jgi:hypothetical protein